MTAKAAARLMAVLGVAIVLSSLLLPVTEVVGEPTAQISPVIMNKPNAGVTKIDTTTNKPITSINKVDAAKLVQTSVVEPLLAKADLQKGLRVLEFQDVLPVGTRIEPAFTPVGKKPEVLVAENPSWLLMIDEAPAAHFAHPVKLILVDSTTQKQQVIETEWWPKVNSKQVFETVSARTDPSVVTFYKAPSLEVSQAMINPNYRNIGESTQCYNWAVIVCGYNDPSDTFHLDTNGIYNVLKSFGLDDSHIFYLSPQTGDPGVDKPTNIANVQSAISEVASHAKSSDKVLFFYSSHGGVDSLSCAPDVDPVGSIAASDLASWLRRINCKEMSIIVEACHSGSLIGKYSDGRYIAPEDDLTGHGESNRIVFTSASTDTSSYADVDGSDDPNSASDAGSESIYGFIMAYSEASADTNHDGQISFGEAYQYAWNTDVTRIRGVNVPQLKEAGLSKNGVYIQCLQSSGSKPQKKPLTRVPMTIPIGPPEPNPISTTTSQVNAMS